MSDLPNPESRVEQYLANLTDGATEIPTEPESRIEQYLDYLVKNGGVLNYGTVEGTASGKALVAKTIVDGKVTEWEFADAGGLKIHICTSSEYSLVSREPVIASPDEKTLYLVPAENASSPDLFVEWAYVNNNWEMFGSASIDLSGFLTDVQVNGTSVVSDGVANVDLSVIAKSENDVTASSSYSIGQYFLRNNNLCKATASISVGETLTLDTNYTMTTVAEEIYSALNS